MTTLHTPGPWEVGPTDNSVVTDVYTVADLSSENNKMLAPGFETLPNARLIAAAPELLEALGLALEWMRYMHISANSPLHIKLQAAIYKATKE